MTKIAMRMWRNGRRTRLKILRWWHRVGSSPTIRSLKRGIALVLTLLGQYLFLCAKRDASGYENLIVITGVRPVAQN